jgi:hypothetical protein
LVTRGGDGAAGTMNITGLLRFSFRLGWMGRGAVGGGGGDQTGDPWVTPLPRRDSQDSLSRPAGVLVSRFRWEMLVLEEVGLGDWLGSQRRRGKYGPSCDLTL